MVIIKMRHSSWLNGQTGVRRHVEGLSKPYISYFWRYTNTTPAENGASSWVYRPMSLTHMSVIY